MDIAKIDKNFSLDGQKTVGEKVFYTIPSKPFDLYGIYYEKESKRFVRMPSMVAEKVSQGVAWLNPRTAGGRLKFSTDSSVIEIRVKYKTLTKFPHMPLVGTSGFILLEDLGENYKLVKSFMPTLEDEEGFTSFVETDGKMKNYVLFFPTYNDVISLQIGLDKKAKVSHGTKYKKVKPILYYGSSITEGACASRADNNYMALISKWTNTDYINLGFSGNAKAEDDMTDYLASVDCSLFVCDYDYNADDAEYLQKTHYRLYERYRKINSKTPIVFISCPNVDCEDAEKRRKIVRQTYKNALSNGDKNVYYIDGKKLFGKFDRENCTVDNIHPNDFGFYLMAKEIYKVIKKLV